MGEDVLHGPMAGGTTVDDVVVDCIWIFFLDLLRNVCWPRQP